MANQPIIDYRLGNTTAADNFSNIKAWNHISHPEAVERVAEVLEMIMVELSELRIDIETIKRKIDAT